MLGSAQPGSERWCTMRFQFAEIFGIAAALASLYAAHSKTMIPLRWAAIAANALAMVYSALHGTWPTFALNAILLPTNAWRLYAMLRLIRDIDQAIKSDMSAEWLLPYARPKTFQAGDVMMARGDYATAAFYIAAGEVEIPELGQTLGKGTLLGEIGLFTPDGRRTMTVRCRTDVNAAVLDYDRFKELYFQNPQFGYRLLQMIVARMQQNSALALSAAPP
jgi:CRP/FNR family transcriptional regulator, cyclic AMP receptor protein